MWGLSFTKGDPCESPPLESLQLTVFPLYSKRSRSEGIVEKTYRAEDSGTSPKRNGEFDADAADDVQFR